MVAAEQSAHNSSPYFETTEQGNVLPLDPVTGEALHPGVIPESLRADEELQKGYDFLRNNAGRIDICLLLSKHDQGEDIADAGIDLGAEAQDLASKQGVLFLEGVATGKERAQLQDVLNYISNLTGDQAETARQNLRASNNIDSFRAESFSQMVGTQVEIAQPDYLTDSVRPADAVLVKWKKTMDETLEGSNPSLKDIDKWYSLNVGFTAYRDWYLVGKIGSYLADREAKQNSLQPGAITSKLLVGSTHSNLGRHLEGFGISVDYVGEVGDKRSPQVARLVNAVGNVVLTQQARIDQSADILLAEAA